MVTKSPCARKCSRKIEEEPWVAWLKPDFEKQCRKWYSAAQDIDNRRRLRRASPSSPTGLGIFGALNGIGDPLIDVDPVAAASAYRQFFSRRSKADAALYRAVHTCEAQQMANYAVAFSRAAGISMRRAVLDAVARWAMRGAFIRNGGRPVSFERAVRAVFDAARDNSSAGLHLGFTGKSIRVKPAIPGTIVRRPDCNMRTLDADGEEVPDTLFWRQRLANGDVVQVP
jgi:hypothetical protein